MESAARDIRKKFQEITAFSLPMPSLPLLRKAIISVKKGKNMFSIDQLVQVVAVLMGNLSYVLFRYKSNRKNYVVLFFWATHVNDKACQVKKKR